MRGDAAAIARPGARAARSTALDAKPVCSMTARCLIQRAPDLPQVNRVSSGVNGGVPVIRLHSGNSNCIVFRLLADICVRERSWDRCGTPPHALPTPMLRLLACTTRRTSGRVALLTQYCTEGKLDATADDVAELLEGNIMGVRSPHHRAR